MISFAHSHIVPAAYALLPERMQSPSATAMLLAIGLQESDFAFRRQMGNGPARGFWQFEMNGGLKGIALHPATRDFWEQALADLQYPVPMALPQLHLAIEHNDVLACVAARLLLWTLPDTLPMANQSSIGWTQYLYAWRPGKPHPETWSDHFARAWGMVAGEAETPARRT